MFHLFMMIKICSFTVTNNNNYNIWISFWIVFRKTELKSHLKGFRLKIIVASITLTYDILIIFCPIPFEITNTVQFINSCSSSLLYEQTYYYTLNQVTIS